MYLLLCDIKGSSGPLRSIKGFFLKITSSRFAYPSLLHKMIYFFYLFLNIARYTVAQVSYGMYLLHPTNLALFSTYAQFFIQHPYMVVVLLPFFYVIVFLEAVILYLLIEKPVMNLRK
jgi:hypothetical protein